MQGTVLYKQSKLKTPKVRHWCRTSLVKECDSNLHDNEVYFITVFSIEVTPCREDRKVGSMFNCKGCLPQY